MKSTRLLLFMLNLFGMAAYVYLASRGWRDPSEGGVIPLAGEPFVWAACLPVLFLFVILDLVWAALILAKKLTFWAPLGMVAALWTLSVVIDFAHH